MGFFVTDVCEITLARKCGQANCHEKYQNICHTAYMLCAARPCACLSVTRGGSVKNGWS